MLVLKRICDWFRENHSDGCLVFCRDQKVDRIGRLFVAGWREKRCQKFRNELLLAGVFCMSELPLNLPDCAAVQVVRVFPRCALLSA